MVEFFFVKLKSKTVSGRRPALGASAAPPADPPPAPGASAGPAAPPAAGPAAPPASGRRSRLPPPAAGPASRLPPPVPPRLRLPAPPRLQPPAAPPGGAARAPPSAPPPTGGGVAEIGRRRVEICRRRGARSTRSAGGGRWRRGPEIRSEERGSSEICSEGGEGNGK